MHPEKRVIAEGIELFVGSVFAVDDQRFVFGDVKALAEILEDRRHLRLESLAEKLSVDVLESVVLARQDIQRALAVAGFDALERIDLHLRKQGALFRQLMAEEGTVRRVGIDRLPSARPAAKADD